MQVTQQQLQNMAQNAPNATTIKQEPGAETTTSQQQQTQGTNAATTAGGQNIIAHVQLPNGQMGQLVAATPQMWPGNTINLSNLGKRARGGCSGGDGS